MRKASILIFGNGRIGQAVRHYCKENPATAKVDFFTAPRDLSSYDLFIGALAGKLGEKCLALALRYKKNLIDISDIDPPFYLRHKKVIEKRGILVIPGCGFSPGLVNCILGREMENHRLIGEVEIKAGSLAPILYYFPFLWCFEDLISEHQIPSWQILDDKKIKCPPFTGYIKEDFFNIPAESYYCASGFENLFKKIPARNFIYRVVRPRGFREFFLFLRNQGFLNKTHYAFTKKVVEGHTEDNITFAKLVLAANNKKIVWLIKSFSGKDEMLNSMQKITALVPATIAEGIISGTFKKKGLLFMEDLGRDPEFFSNLVANLSAKGIKINRS